MINYFLVAKVNHNYALFCQVDPIRQSAQILLCMYVCVCLYIHTHNKVYSA
jgi:hypothetical protein